MKFLMSSVVIEVISILDSAWEVQWVVPGCRREGADRSKNSLEQEVETGCMLYLRIFYSFEWEKFKCIQKRKYEELGKEDRELGVT